MKTLNTTKNIKIIGAVAAVSIFALLPLIFQGSSYFSLIASLVCIYTIAVSGLDISFGYTGQISLGHAGFYAIGAYTSAILRNNIGMPVLFCMIIGACLSGLVGAILAIPTSKLVFHFLSLATIAFGEIIYLLITRSPAGITGDYAGLFTEPVSFFGINLDTHTKFYYFGLVCVIIFLLAKNSIYNSRVGRAFVAIKENVHAANGMGVNVRKYKVIAFTLSALYTGFAGAMYVHLINYISPETFMQKQSVMFLTMLLLGGTGSIIGPILGSISVLLLTEALRSFADYQVLVYGLLLLVVIVAIPGGFNGLIKKVTDKYRSSKQGGIN